MQEEFNLDRAMLLGWVTDWETNFRTHGGRAGAATASASARGRLQPNRCVPLL